MLTPALNGSSVKTGSTGGVTGLGLLLFFSARRNVGAESESGSELSLTVGSRPRLMDSGLFFARRSSGRLGLGTEPSLGLGLLASAVSTGATALRGISPLAE